MGLKYINCKPVSAVTVSKNQNSHLLTAFSRNTWIAVGEAVMVKISDVQ